MRGMRPIAVDLFAGAGGLSLGFEQAGFDVLAAVEYDPVHAAVHEFNFPFGKTFCRDIRNVTGCEIRQLSEIGDREIDVVAGGPPCQGISLIGKRNLDDERNELLKEYVRVVLELNPRYFVMENVSGLTIGRHCRLLDEVIRLFEKNGYVIAEYKVLQAAEYGVPQSRKRLFLIGSRADQVTARYPKPLCTPRTLDGKLGKGTLEIGVSVADAILDLPNVDDYKELLTSDSVAVSYGPASLYAQCLRGDREDPHDYSYPRLYDKNLLTSSARTKHTEQSVKRFASTKPGETEPVSRFKRLHPEGISNTLRAGTGSDRGAYTAPRPIHPRYDRVITVREAARLHGYPDWFRFHVTKWNGFREVGNSVPVPLARAVAAEIISALGVSPEKGLPCKLGDTRLLSFTQREAEEYFGIEERVIPLRSKRRSASDECE